MLRFSRYLGLVKFESTPPKVGAAHPADDHAAACLVAFLECFNAGQYFEAHDALEPFWLARRATPEGIFCKGLIQLAGAFVHLQRHSPRAPRLRPAGALLRLARNNLKGGPSVCLGLRVEPILAMIDAWAEQLETQNFSVNPLLRRQPPQLARP